MANIASQKKRIQRTARERLENRRRVSQVRTWFRRLQDAVDAGDAARIDEEFRALVSRVDRAVKTGALHKNTGARRKPRAAQKKRGPPPQGARCPHPLGRLGLTLSPLAGTLHVAVVGHVEWV